MNSAFPADAEFASWKDEAADKDMEVGSFACLFGIACRMQTRTSTSLLTFSIQYERLR